VVTLIAKAFNYGRASIRTTGLPVRRTSISTLSQQHFGAETKNPQFSYLLFFLMT